MRVREFGGGPTVLLLHGGNVAGWMWGPQLEALEGYRVLVPDLPGFGESNSESWISIDDTADRVAYLIEDQDHAHVVGLSLGSSIALHLAARHPKAVASLFLASAQVTPPSSRDARLAILLLKFWARPGFWRFLARSYGLRGDDADLFVSTGLGIRRETAETIYREVLCGVPATVLERVSAPTIAVAGERDSRAITGESLETLAGAIPSSHRAIAPGMHHQWNVENPQLFNEALRTWLDRGEVATGLRASI